MLTYATLILIAGLAILAGSLINAGSDDRTPEQERRLCDEIARQYRETRP